LRGLVIRDKENWGVQAVAEKTLENLCMESPLVFPSIAPKRERSPGRANLEVAKERDNLTHDSTTGKRKRSLGKKGAFK